MSSSDNWTTGEPYRAVGAVDHVFRALREAIEGRAFPIGGKLAKEAELAARFGVSRSVIREALRSCNVIGLTETRTGKGTFVVSHTPTGGLRLGRYSARELHEARPHVEVPAAELAASRRTAAELDVLTDLVARMDATTDIADWVGLDSRFHSAIASASRNRIFVAVVADIRETMVNQSEILTRLAGRRAASNDEHQAILAALAAGDPAAAGRAMQAHLAAVHAEIGRYFTDPTPP